MDQTPAAVSSGEMHSAPGMPDIFQDLSALHVVFAKLSPRELCAVVQTCKTLRQLADMPWVWKAQAQQIWGPLAAPHLGGYATHKALLLDDCRRAAVLSLPLPQNAACSYVNQQPNYYFKCKLLQLQWVRSDNSLRLSFDARGEPDLRRPITSSLAVVHLQPSRQQQQRNPANTSAAAAAVQAAATTGHGSAAPGAGAGAARLDWSRRLAVFDPDDCQLIADKPGLFKGVLVWHSSKCNSILSLLFANQQQAAQQQPQQQQSAPPMQQHRRAQRSRRSDAWEEWAGWELEQQQQQQQEQQAQPAVARAGSSRGHGSGYNNRHTSAARLGSFLQAVVRVSGNSEQQQQPLQQQTSSGIITSSSASTGSAPAAAAAASGARAAQVGLVFCYANDLASYSSSSWTGFGLQPDYQPVLLVSSPGSAAAAAAQQCSAGTAAVSGAAGGSAPATVSSTTSSIHVPALPVAELQLPVQLHHPQEAQWAAAWLRVPAVCVQQRGMLEQQMQAESDADERARWSDLPEAVQRRGAAWWKYGCNNG